MIRGTEPVIEFDKKICNICVHLPSYPLTHLGQEGFLL